MAPEYLPLHQALAPDADTDAIRRADPDWQRLKSIVARASELPAAERTAFVARECGDDAALGREAVSLLAGHCLILSRPPDL